MQIKKSLKLEGEILEIGEIPYSLKGINYVLDMYMQFEFTN